MKKALLLFMIYLLTLKTGVSQTYVNGGIYSNTTWTLANSPYIVTDTVVVLSSVTLTIQPGVVVKFDNTVGLIQVKGMLYADGTPSDSIIFTSNSATPYAGIYNGIQLSTNPQSFRYCRFSYAKEAIMSTGNGYPIAHCLFMSNLQGIGFAYAGPIDTCTFMYDTIGTIEPGTGCYPLRFCEFIQNGIGISMLNGGPLLNSIFRNNNYGLYSVGGGSCGGHVLIENCTFDSNRAYGLYSVGTDTIRSCIIRYNGVGVKTSNNVITSNDISDNYIGIETTANGDKISCNSICNNTHYNMSIQSPSNQSAADNYWCLPDSASIQATIYDAYQDFNLGFVYFTPFYTSACASVPTGISEVSSVKTTITLYPNPNRGRFNLHLSSTLQASVDIYSMLGEKVFSTKTTTTDTPMDLSNMPDGIYLFRVITNTGDLVKEGEFIIEK
jgi:hypothetical protein